MWRRCTRLGAFDGFIDHCLCIVDLNEITRPVIVSKWWLPGMNRAAGEVSTAPKGKRNALHHMIVAGKFGYGAWRDGGFTIHAEGTRVLAADTPARPIDPRPNVALAAKTADVYVTRDGLIYASDWNVGLHALEYQG